MKTELIKIRILFAEAICTILLLISMTAGFIANYNYTYNIIDATLANKWLIHMSSNSVLCILVMIIVNIIIAILDYKEVKKTK